MVILLSIIFLFIVIPLLWAILVVLAKVLAWLGDRANCMIYSTLTLAPLESPASRRGFLVPPNGLRGSWWRRPCV